MRPARPMVNTMPGHSEATRGRLRRINLVTLLPPLAAVGALLVAVDARTWWDAAVLSLGVAAALVIVERWTAGDLSRVAVPCLAVTGAVWVFGVFVTGGHTASYGLSVVGPVLVAQLPRRRGPAITGLVVFVAAVGAARLLVSHEAVADVLLLYVLLPTGVVGAAIGLQFANRLFYTFVEQAREREAELAVVRERVRFAGDLHDIQGHTLHVVKLKIALAEKLLDGEEPERVRQELREVHALVGDTITQTKALAYAQRRLNLSVELENAKNLFEAAGIRVRVDRETGVDERVNEQLGQVLRETTTNILRHAQATRVSITLSKTGIDIVNDGAADGPLPGLRGLSALRERVAGDGGQLTVAQENGRFRTAAQFPDPGPGTRRDRPRTRKDDR
ncbi:sensor histidine kinase [Streptomyces avicenniae]|uniref:sensor histidine kinase n=1 Tax=Streptomyces avicenniae TaxID=500153 RepID=UPI000A8D2980|nr:histidine kinase [Streptomyces avicenniae]